MSDHSLVMRWQHFL